MSILDEFTRPGSIAEQHLTVDLRRKINNSKNKNNSINDLIVVSEEVTEIEYTGATTDATITELFVNNDGTTQLTLLEEIAYLFNCSGMAVYQDTSGLGNDSILRFNIIANAMIINEPLPGTGTILLLGQNIQKNEIIKGLDISSVEMYFDKVITSDILNLKVKGVAGTEIKYYLKVKISRLEL